MPEDYDLDLENSGAVTEEDEIGKKKIGFLPAIVIKILKWVAIVLAAVVFIVTVVVVTIKIMNPVSQAPDYYFETEELRNTQPNLQWYDIGTSDIRARTADIEKKIIVIIKVSVGFNEKSKYLHQELIDKTPKLRDEIRVFFGEKHEVDLLPKNEGKIKEELKIRINRKPSSKGSDSVQDVIFTEFNIVEF